MKHLPILFGRIILLLGLVIVSRVLLYAQGGREFWFVAPEVTSRHADAPVLFRFSAFDKDADIVMSQPANLKFEPLFFHLAANTSIAIDLTQYKDMLEAYSANQIWVNGIHIEATNNISASYEVNGRQSNKIVNSEIFTLKGASALGTTFYIPMQTHWDNYYTSGSDNIFAFASFDIVATEDGTQVTISPTQNILDHEAGTTFTVTLKKGEVYSARAESFIGSRRPAGSKVVSNKPIAITYKDDSIFQPRVEKEDAANGNWDLIGDQLIPVKGLGTHYIAIKASQRSTSIDRVFLCATQNNTEIYIKGDTFKLHESETFIYLLKDQSVYITSNVPVYAFHVGGFTNELGGALLPPLTCAGGRRVMFARTNAEDFALNILVRAGGEAHFVLNGDPNAIPSNAFSPVSGTNGAWMAAQIFFSSTDIIPTKAYSLVNNKEDFNLATLNGAAVTGFRYGYFSGFGNINLGGDKFLCANDSVLLDAGFGKDEYRWSTGDTLSSSIIVKNDGTYTVSVRKEQCYFYDTIKVMHHPPITKMILGADTGVCANESLVVQAKNQFLKYRWHDGTSKNSFLAKDAGPLVLQVIDSNHCSKTDTLKFVKYPLPSPEILTDQTTEQICTSGGYGLYLNKEFLKQTWSNGEQTRKIWVVPNDQYQEQVSVVTEQGCSGTAYFKVDCSAYITVPNIITPNGDGVNDRFHIRNLAPDRWKLNVSNRYGAVLFQSNAYTNDWGAEQVPDGIYFYTLKDNELGTLHKGWLQVLR